MSTEGSTDERAPGTATAASSLQSDIVVSVRRRSEIATGVVELVLGRPDQTELPPWTPGAHIDVHLDAGLVRQYSLCGDPKDRMTWTIAVLHDRDGRGGSRKLHHEITEGDYLSVSTPRNHFPLEPLGPYLFIAGGIGITPLLPMLSLAQERGAEWRLCYGGRDARSMAYAHRLSEDYCDRVLLLAEDNVGRIDLDAELGQLPAGTQVYCCGPEGLISAVEARCSALPGLALHFERFSPAPLADSAPTVDFQAQLASSGVVLGVPANRSLLDVLLDNGIEVLSSCAEGTCGSCEIPVISGEIDHRDSVLTDEERASHDAMMVCVSRGAGSGLIVLDL